jgi:hypothetical protein
MSACLYRLQHEYDDDGICRYCYELKRKRVLVVGDDGQRLEASPLAKLSCSIQDCDDEAANLVRMSATTWSTRCSRHTPEEPYVSTAVLEG